MKIISKNMLVFKLLYVYLNFFKYYYIFAKIFLVFYAILFELRLRVTFNIYPIYIYIVALSQAFWYT